LESQGKKSEYDEVNQTRRGKKEYPAQKEGREDSKGGGRGRKEIQKKKKTTALQREGGVGGISWAENGSL